MDSKLANQFIIAATTIFKKVGNITLKKTGLEYFPKGTKVSAGIAAILGITGDYKGQFIIVLNEDMALKIATAILMGVPVTTYDEIAESAVSEIGNMIGGEASRLLHDGGFVCDLTVPAIARGKEMEIAFYPASPLFSIRFESEWGELKLILRFEEK